MRLRRRPKPVTIEIENGLRMSITTLRLLPGEETEITVVRTDVVCDRGLGKPDGKHETVIRDIPILLRIRVVES